MDKDIVIVAARRSAIGSLGRSLASVSARHLGAQTARATLSGLDTDKIDLVYVGNVLSAGLGQNISRQIALDAGLRYEVPAITINQVCGSGLYSIILAAQALQTGMGRAVLAGGVENMSQAPYLLTGHRWGSRMGHQKVKDSMITDGLWDAFGDYHMGVTAENVAEEWKIPRQEQDDFALCSQQKAAAAQRNGDFSAEIGPIDLPDGSKFQHDECIRTDTGAEKLAALKPVFKKDGTVTAGNSSGLSDGAAMMLLTDKDFASEHRWPVLAHLRAWNSRGLEPRIMGYGPAPSITQLLEQQGLKKSEIEMYEINEAFASQSLAVVKDLELDPDTVNPCGGAIALGHPIGASGARIVCTLLHSMRRRSCHYGVAGLCVGGGMGTSVLLEIP